MDKMEDCNQLILLHFRAITFKTLKNTFGVLMTLFFCIHIKRAIIEGNEKNKNTTGDPKFVNDKVC